MNASSSKGTFQNSPRIEDYLKDFFDEKDDARILKILGTALKTGPLAPFSGKSLQRDFFEFVWKLCRGEERTLYESWRRRPNGNATALHFASHMGYSSVCRTLIQTFQYNVNAPAYKEGGTPLHLAAAKNHISTVKSLLDLGADVDIKDSMGNTALHIAAARGYGEIVQLLSTRGAKRKENTVAVDLKKDPHVPMDDKKVQPPNPPETDDSTDDMDWEPLKAQPPSPQKLEPPELNNSTDEMDWEPYRH